MVAANKLLHLLEVRKLEPSCLISLLDIQTYKHSNLLCPMSSLSGHPSP